MEITQEMVELALQVPAAMELFIVLPPSVKQVLRESDGDLHGLAEFMVYHPSVRKSAIARALAAETVSNPVGQSRRPVATDVVATDVVASEAWTPAVQKSFRLEDAPPPIVGDNLASSSQRHEPPAATNTRTTLLGMELGTRDLQLSEQLEIDLLAILPSLPSFARKKDGKHQSYSHMLFILILRYGILTTKREPKLTKARVRDVLTRYVNLVCGSDCSKEERAKVWASAQGSLRRKSQPVERFRASPKAYAAGCAAALAKELQTIAPVVRNSEMVNWLLATAPQEANRLLTHLNKSQPAQ